MSSAEQIKSEDLPAYNLSKTKKIENKGAVNNALEGPHPPPPYSEQNLSGGKTCVTWGQGLWLLANIGRFSSQDKVPIALSSGVRTPSPGPQLSFSTQVASLLEVVTQPSGEVRDSESTSSGDPLDGDFQAWGMGGPLALVPSNTSPPRSPCK